MKIIQRWSVWAASFGVATLLTVLSATQSYASRRVEGLPAVWARLVPTAAIDWYAWALLAPFILAAASRLPWRRERRVAFALTWIGLAAVGTLTHALIEVVVARRLSVVGTGMSFHVMVSARFASTVAPGMIVFLMLVLLYYAAAHFRDAAALEARLAEAQLESLRRQLQPHFLFNALHTVSALITEDTAAARRVLTRLGDLLRLSLQHAESQEVTVADELAFLESYLDIQRVRFRERLIVRVDVAEDARRAAVPSLLLQPLAENAVRHSIEPRASGGTIEIRIVRAADSLAISVRDDGPGISNGGGLNGIGLANTRERLTRLHGSAQSLVIANDPRGGARVDITLPFREIG